jgi:hypothetical protein
MSKEWPSRGKNRASYEPVGKRLDIAINFVVLVLVAILFTETGIAQTDVPFLKRHEGDYVGVPSSASVALLSARPGDTDRTQDPAAVDLRELERRTRQMVNARVQEEALLHVDAHLSAKEPVELRRLTAVESPGAAQPRGTIVYLHGSRAPGDAVDVLPIGYSALSVLKNTIRSTTMAGSSPSRSLDCGSFQKRAIGLSTWPVSRGALGWPRSLRRFQATSPAF